jgi:glycosyltransferase involved in cell wall biosynthesis
MPAYNEDSGIAEFIGELHEHLKEWHPTFFVVDDCSKDQTVVVATALAEQGIAIKVVPNEVNSGHGPSTVRALQLGLTNESEFVVAIDGDGQFLGSDVAKIVQLMLESNCDIAEGVRTQRGDPIYRQFVSLTTRLLVFSRSRRFPRDANTPLRVYRVSALRRHLDALNPDTMIPNLVISSNSRRWKMNVQEIEVRSIPRRGLDQSSITWGKSRRQLPTRRFLKFCVGATKDFFKGD